MAALSPLCTSQVFFLRSGNHLILLEHDSYALKFLVCAPLHSSAHLLPSINRMQDKPLLFTQKFTGFVPVTFLQAHAGSFNSFKAMQPHFSWSGHPAIRTQLTSLLVMKDRGQFWTEKCQAETNLKIYLFCLLQLHSFMKQQRCSSI